MLYNNIITRARLEDLSSKSNTSEMATSRYSELRHIDRPQLPEDRNSTRIGVCTFGKSCSAEYLQYIILLPC